MADKFCFLGRHSYVIYIWHQVAIAFLLLFVFSEVNFICLAAVVAATAVLVLLSHATAMCRPVIWMKSKIIAVALAVALTFSFAAATYVRKGVFFQYPELGIRSAADDPDGWIHYVDRVYQWNQMFEKNDKKKVLVIGNSFGRDFANILSESFVHKQLDISYIPSNADFEEMKPKIDSAEVVFYSVDAWVAPEKLIHYCYDKLWIVGNKCFSKNTKVWLKRHQADYLDATEEVSTDFLENNRKFAERYQNHYIDMMSVVMFDDKRERVFTDTGCYISVDGKHLSQEGAKFYAKMLDIAGLVEVS